MNQQTKVAKMRAVLAALSDQEVAAVFQALDGFIDTQASAEDEVTEAWNVPALEQIVGRI